MDSKDEMAQIKESEQNRVAIRVCPECAKAFFALESEDAVCGSCGARLAGKTANKSSGKDALSKNARR